MNERIKELRKALGLTLEEFGAKIGMGKSSVSKIEKGLNGTTDQTIRSICREFKVSEDWLRTGEGDMFDQEQPSILARLSSEYKLTAREQSVVAAFLELDEADRQRSCGMLTSWSKNSLRPPRSAIPPPKQWRLREITWTWSPMKKTWRATPLLPPGSP